MELENTVLHEDLRGYVDTRLTIRFAVYIAISVIILGIILYHVFMESDTSIYTGMALLVGAVLGIAISRIFRIRWDNNVGKVISNIDAQGVVILVLYVLFEVFRERIVEYFINGPTVAITSLALLGGVMIGRVLGIHRKILTEIKQHV